MPNQLNSGELIASINTDLADNNAGSISAYDVRHNMEDIAFSINSIVASGDTEVEFPFFNPVKLSIADSSSPTAGAGPGDGIVESGLFFPNAEDATKQAKRQTEPWLGDTGINHDNLQNLSNDTHTQYYNRLGVDAARGNALLGNMATDDKWVNASGIEGVGFSFTQTSPDATEQEINVSGTMRWHDNSLMENGKGVAKAYCNFDANSGGGVPAVRSYYNVSGIQRLAEGKLQVTFNSGVLDNNDYVCVASANGTTSAASQEDFSVNTVGTVLRAGDDGTALRSVTFTIKNENGDYVDSERCDLVVYGHSPGESYGTPPTVS